MDCVLTRFAEFSIKNDIHPEISSKMENQLREYISFGGVCPYLKYKNITLILFWTPLDF